MGEFETVRWTAYAEEVLNVCKALDPQGDSPFNLTDVAMAMGRKVTHNLRRRIRLLEEGGYLSSFKYYTVAGGMSTAYNVRIVQHEMEFPF